MIGWARVKLRDLYEVHNGLSKSRKFFGHGHPFLTFSTVFNHFFLPENLGSSVESTPEEQLSFSIKRGDVFITRTSETAEELGMSAVALIDYPQATYNGFCKRLRPISDCRILPEYAGYVLRAPEFRTRFYGLAGSMTSRASLRNDDLLEMDIPLPELSVQRKVSKCLFNYESAIDNARRQIALLEEAAMRLYREWFVVNADPKWEKKTFGTFAKVARGRVITKATAHRGEVPVVAAGLSPAYFTEKANVKAPSVTISASGANAGYVWYHANDIWASDCSYLSKNETPYVYFSYAFLKTHSAVLKGLQKGSAQPHVHGSDIEGISFFVPGDDLVRQYEMTVDPVFQKIGVNEKLITSLTEARDRLLPKLMSGEIEV